MVLRTTAAGRSISSYPAFSYRWIAACRFVWVSRQILLCPVFLA